MSDEKAVQRSISLYPKDLATIEALAQREGCSNSAAIRKLVRWWQDHQAERVEESACKVSSSS